MADPILDILARTGWFDPTSDENDDLRDQGLDSLGLALFLSDLEREFKIRIPVDALTVDAWSTVAKMRAQLEMIQGGGKTP